MAPTNNRHRQLNILDASIPARTLIFSLVIPSFIEELGQILTSGLPGFNIELVGVSVQTLPALATVDRVLRRDVNA